jgi:protein CpxP
VLREIFFTQFYPGITLIDIALATMSIKSAAAENELYNINIEELLMKTRSVIKASLVALVASSALLASQLYAADTTTDTEVKTASMYQKGDMHHGRKGGMHHDRKGGMHKMMHMLDLTAAQKTDVKAIMQKYQANCPERPSKERRAEHRAEMLALITSAGFDETKATEMAEAQQQQHMQKMLTHLKMQNEMYQLLTSEQQQTFQDQFNLGRGHMSRR